MNTKTNFFLLLSVFYFLGCTDSVSFSPAKKSSNNQQVEAEKDKSKGADESKDKPEKVKDTDKSHSPEEEPEKAKVEEIGHDTSKPDMPPEKFDKNTEPSKQNVSLKNVEMIVTASEVNKKLDILIINDNSKSMLPVQNRVGRGLQDMINQFPSDTDWRIGVTTTDVLRAPSRLPTTEGVEGNLYRFSNNKLYINSLKHEEEFYHSIVSKDNCGVPYKVDGGSNLCSAAFEQPLGALSLALEKKESSNKGFFRDNADLVAIILSDEDEMSDGLSANATRPEKVLKVFKKTMGYLDKKFMVYSVIIVPGDTECLLNNRQRMTSDTSNTVHYGRYAFELSQLTKGKVFSLCDIHFSKYLAEISDHMKKILFVDSVFLGLSKPFKDSLVIEFEPKGYQMNWSYNEVENKIYFQKKLPPSIKAKVKFKIISP